ncbi:hypothetical protein [Coralliovum pocilloporae]|uniref:hypothetical protein n=1 Tax=Coralliovum pocilloporae TaxID=3066369 RepID=UPI0033075467
MDDVAERLCALYTEPFGGKDTGRYRIATKLVRKLAGRRRLYEDDIQALSRSMLERGYVLIDMDAFFVVLSVGTFGNYRRANEESLDPAYGKKEL